MQMYRVVIYLGCCYWWLNSFFLNGHTNHNLKTKQMIRRVIIDIKMNHEL